jgi:hypothetical protein
MFCLLLVDRDYCYDPDYDKPDKKPNVDFTREEIIVTKTAVAFVRGTATTTLSARATSSAPGAIRTSLFLDAAVAARTAPVS